MIIKGIPINLEDFTNKLITPKSLEFKKGDKVIDKNSYTGTVFKVHNTGQVAVQQKPNVTCTYDNAGMLRKFTWLDKFDKFIESKLGAFLGWVWLIIILLALIIGLVECIQ